MGRPQGKKVTFHKSVLQQTKFKSQKMSRGISVIPKHAVTLKLTNIKDRAVKKNLKKRKMHLRRDSLRKKLEKGKKGELEKLAQMKRKETVIIGDMQPLLAALMENTNNICPSKPAKPEINLPKSKKFTIKRRMKEIADGLEYFKRAMDINK